MIESRRLKSFYVYALLWVKAEAHVPTYDGCVENCCKPPHHHTVSQVIYLRGSGGLEIHFTNDGPFDIDGNETIDVDAVFKQEYDPTSYSLYIGCGGCVWTQDELFEDALHIDGYEPGEVEPFTQHAYRSVFPKSRRTFNAGKLRDCPEQHFTIRLIDHLNRTESEPIIWGAVVGLKESFTTIELLSFPLFVLRNHGSRWNQLPWTWWVILVSTLFLVWTAREIYACTCSNELNKKIAFMPIDTYDQTERKRWSSFTYMRVWLYDLAIITFLAVMIEEFVHLCIAQSQATFGAPFWIGLLGVILFANGFPILTTYISWHEIYNENYTRRFKTCLSSLPFLAIMAALSVTLFVFQMYIGASFILSATILLSIEFWEVLEALVAVSYLWLFGAGFFLGPFFLFLAALVRIYEGFYVPPPP